MLKQRWQAMNPDIFRHRVGQVRASLADWLETFHPGPKTFAVAWCVGATIGQFAAQAGLEGVSAAIAALSAQLGVNLLADIIGDQKPPVNLTVEAIADAVRQRLEQGEDLPAIQRMLDEVGTLRIAAEVWTKAEDSRQQQLLEELRIYPQLVAGLTSDRIAAALRPELADLRERDERLEALILDVLKNQEAAHLLQQAPESPDEVLLAEYCTQVARQTQYLDLSGIPYSSPAPLPIETLYIQPRLLEWVERDENPAPASSDTKTWVRQLVTRSQAERRQDQEAIRDDWTSGANLSLDTVEVDTLLEPGHRCVVLGEAGTGKSTLLRFLAHRLAQRDDSTVPILVSLGAFARRPDPRLSLAEFALGEISAPWGDKGPAVHAALRRAMQAGWAVLFLDGLDETGEAQADVAAALLAMPGWESSSTVITSRPDAYWRTGKPSAIGKLRYYELQRVDSKQIRSFAKAWLTHVGRQLGRESSWVQDRTEWFEQQLDENPLAQEVASNPLMLTFLVILAGRAIRLPQVPTFPIRRNDLYTAFIEGRGEDEALLSGWERHKDGGSTTQSVAGLMPDEVNQAFLDSLSVIGWQLHVAYFGGQPENVYWETIVDPLAEKHRVAWDLAPARARLLAQKALEFWVRAGLLICHDAPNGRALSFRHLTFQEFTASRQLTRLWRDAPERVPWHLAAATLWQDVFALAAGGLRDATGFVETLLAHGGEDPLEPHLHLQTLSAALCLAESGEADDRLGRRIVDELMSYFALGIDDLSRMASDRLVALGRSRLAPLVHEALIPQIGATNHSTRYGALGTLASLDALAPEVLEAFLAFINEQTRLDRPKGVIRGGPESALLPRVVAALGRYRPPDQRVQDALFTLATTAKVTIGLLDRIARSLTDQDRPDLVKQIRSRFPPLLESLMVGTADRLERTFLGHIADALSGNVKNGPPSGGLDLVELRRLFTLLQAEDWPYDWVSEIAQAGIDYDGCAILKIAARLLGQSPDQLAAQARAAAESDPVLQMRRIWQNDRVQPSPATLASSQPLSVEEIDVLVAALDSKAEWVSTSAAILLSGTYPTEDLHQALIRAMKTEAETSTRIWATRIPGWLESRSPDIREALMTALQIDPEPAVRAFAAASLQRFVEDSDLVVAGLVQALGDVSREVRASAAGSLGEVRHVPAAIVDSLVLAWNEPEPPGKCVHCGTEVPPDQETCPNCHIVGTTSKAAMIEAIGKLADPTPAMAELLADGLRSLGLGDAGVPHAAARGIAAMWSKYPAEATELFVNALLKVTETRDHFWGFTHAIELTAKAIADSRQAARSLPAAQLVPLLNHPSGIVRRAIVSWLGRMETDFDTIPVLTQALDDSQVRDEAFVALRSRAESQTLLLHAPSDV